MKRAYCLYRVSTKGQVDKDDIPMQRIACAEFARQQGWEIVKEFSEKGISGYKVSSEKRDAIQTIKADASAGLFDVLLVFMFDRLGRRDDETPFVVQWFVLHSIEVWSVMEGQQRFDNHVDKLLNYIRFWQASGESEKTSTRIRTRHEQMVQEGLFRGGMIPYGYRMIENGEVNKKGHPVHDLAIHDAQAAIIKEIFSKMCYEGFGTHRLARHLNTKYPSQKEWRAAAVNRIIQNTIYKGEIRYKRKHVCKNENLQIVANEVFDRANQILHERTPGNSINRTVPQQTNGARLLTGLLYCGHCGERMVGTIVRDKRILKTGEIHSKERPIYRCYGKDRSVEKCAGQSLYSAKRIEDAVLQIVNQIFAKIHDQPAESLAKRTLDENLSSLKVRLSEIQVEKARLERHQQAIKSELLKAITGEANIDQRVLSNLLLETENSLAQAMTALNQVQDNVEAVRSQEKSLLKQHEKFLGWAEEFDHAEMAAKKMILCSMIDRVLVDRTYTVTVQLNISAKQFIKGL